MPKEIPWSPLATAKSDIQDLEYAVNGCTGGDMARHAASAFGNIEAAFYTHEIDYGIMKEMKNTITTIIQNFDVHCKCEYRK